MFSTGQLGKGNSEKMCLVSVDWHVKTLLQRCKRLPCGGYFAYLSSSSCSVVIL